MPTDWPTFKLSHPMCHTQSVTPDFTTTSTNTHTQIQQLVHQFIKQSNRSTYTHSTNIFTTQHVGTPDLLLADPPEPNLSPRPDWCSKYHGKFTKSLATSQLQLCLFLLLDTYISKKESKIHSSVGLACQQNYSNTLVWVSKYSIEWEWFLLPFICHELFEALGVILGGLN